MKKDEMKAKMAADIENMIDRFHMEQKCGLGRDAIRTIVRRGMVLNNMAFVLADAANTFLMDCERDLSKLGVAFGQKDKYNFKMMLEHITAARKWAEKSALPIYEIPDADAACADSDWWYNFIKLVDDRIGDDPRKTNLLLEYILNMPREVGLFDVKYDDFKTFRKNG